MEKEINSKKYQIKEVSFGDAMEINELRQKNPNAANLKFIQLSTGLSEEEIKKLPMKEGIELSKAVNELNTLDFQEQPKK